MKRYLAIVLTIVVVFTASMTDTVFADETTLDDSNEIAVGDEADVNNDDTLYKMEALTGGENHTDENDAINETSNKAEFIINEDRDDIHNVIGDGIKDGSATSGDEKLDKEDDEEYKGIEEDTIITETLSVTQKIDSETETTSIIKNEEELTEDGSFIDTAYYKEKAAFSNASSAKFDPPLPLPELSGNWREDFIEVAKSQIGYKEAPDESSYFGNWLGQTYRPWCSEFVSWCAYVAGIPETVIAPAKSSKRFIEFFAPKGRYYYIKGGINSLDTELMREYNYTSIKTIQLSSLEPGDILLFETNGNIDDGPDHTAIFLSLQDDQIVNVSGNSNDSVRVTVKSISGLHGVCKPDLSSVITKPKKPTLLSVDNRTKGIQIKWKGESDITGYYVFRSIDGGKFKKIATLKNGRCSYIDNRLKKNSAKYAYKIYSFLTSNGKTNTSDASTTKVCYYLSQSQVKSVKNKASNSLTVSWNKNSKCDGYQIQYSKDKNFQTTKIVTVTPTSVTSKKITGLQKNETYYVRVRPYKKVKNTQYYGAWNKYNVGVKVKK